MLGCFYCIFKTGGARYSILMYMCSLFCFYGCVAPYYKTGLFLIRQPNCMLNYINIDGITTNIIIYCDIWMYVTVWIHYIQEWGGHDFRWTNYVYWHTVWVLGKKRAV